MDRKEVIKNIVIAGAGVIVGYTAGYLITKKRLLAQFEDEKESFRIIRNQEYDTPSEAVEALIKGDEDRPLTEMEIETLDKFIEEHAYGQTKQLEEEAPGLVNIFDGPQEPVVDLEEEFGDLLDTHSVPTVPYIGDTGEIIVPEGAVKPKKTPKVKGGNLIKKTEYPPLPERMDEISAGRPYVISVEEFMNDNPEYEKTTITYFEGDDTLCDEREEIVPDVDGVITTDALAHFGNMSSDRNVVYVRNDRISTDFEVILDKRNWYEVVAGYTQKGAKSGLRKMREDDES